MTLTDYMSKNKGPPEWIEENEIISVRGCVGEDIIVELKLTSPGPYDDLRFELIRDGLPIPSDRYRLSMRGNIVQLALKQSHKNDAGYYSLVATRLGQENDKGASKKIHLSIDETSYEEGDPPVFLRRLSDLAVKVGTRTRFLTEIRSATTPKIAWYKNDVLIREGSRFSLVHEGNFYCVDVAPVTVEDQGRWTCMAENRSGRSSCTSNLTVVVPKAYKRPEFVEELRALLTETGTVSLECKVIGIPTPILRWFKDNKEIKAGDVFALTANPDDPTSLGVYTCEAVNCMGMAYSSSKVHVVGRGSREGSLKPADALTPSGPLPIFRRILQDEYCRIGDTLVLSCQVQVPPWPKAIAWYNKEGRVEPNEKYLIMEDGIGGYSIEMKQVEAMDEGEWKCVATSEENIKQFSSCYVAMSIPRNYRKPRFMENLKAVLTEEGLVSFECKVVGFPTPLLRWFKDGQELKPGDVYQLTGTNSLGSYCCIAKNCMGEARSTAELTIEDIQNQLNEEERFQLLSTNQPPKFIKGLRSCEARINEDFRFTIQVSVIPEPDLSWYRDDGLVDESDKYRMAKGNLGMCHLDVQKLEFVDQGEWKCVAANDFGHSVTSCFLKLIIPKHYKKPKFLEELRAMLSEEGAVNLECKVIGVPQPVLKWYKDNAELKSGDIHRIISGQDGTCCLGTYTCEAINCMGTVSSSASLLGFEERKDAKETQSPNGHELARNLSLSTIHEERTSQLYDTPQTDHSVTLDERGEVSFSFDGKEVSVSLYETPDLTEEEALQIVEMYADQLSEHVTEHNVIELPPMRFVKETSTSGNLLMEAVVIDVSPDYFVSAEDGDDLRTEADFEDVSIMDDTTHVLSSPERDSRGSLKRSARYSVEDNEKAPSKPPRKKSISISSSRSERSQRVESESFHSAQKEEPPLSPLSSLNQDDSDTFADALSSAHLSVTESLLQRHMEAADNRKRSLSAEITNGSSLDDGIGGDSCLDSMTGVAKKKQRKEHQRKDKSNSEEYYGSSDYEERSREESEDKAKIKIESYHRVESIDKTEIGIMHGDEQKLVKQESIIYSEKSTSENEEELLSGSKSGTNILEEIQEPKEDIFREPKITLRIALQSYDKLSNNSATRLSCIHDCLDDIHKRISTPGDNDTDVEMLVNLEVPLHRLLKAIDSITLAEDAEIVRESLQVFVIQLSNIIENLALPSLQPTLTVFKQINKKIFTSLSETEEASSMKLISDQFQSASEETVNPLIDIQSAFDTILDFMKQLGLSRDETTAVLTKPELVTYLAQLKECILSTAQIAMTLQENETLNNLTEFREPLLNLQSVLTSEERISQKLPMLKEIILGIGRLKSIAVSVLKDSERSETISRFRAIHQILEETDKQMSEMTVQLTKAEDARKRILKKLNIDQSLGDLYYALSSVLEKQEKYVVSSNLSSCIEELRQAIGSSAVTIANLKEPTDHEIIREISQLKESLLNLRTNLLTEEHEPREHQILNDLVNPVIRLKDIFHGIIENCPSIGSVMSMLELLEEIEKDIYLVGKETSKKTLKEENVVMFESEDTKQEGLSNSALVGPVNSSLDPVKDWLSTTSEDSTTGKVESILSSTIEELKRDVAKIAVQTSYSESPSDKSLVEALVDLREPLIRLKNAISMYHKSEDLSTLEDLGHPMRYLLQTIMDVLCKHAEEGSLRPIVDIVRQIENQISLTIKDTLYCEENKQSATTSTVETEETVTASRETIPDTFTEIASPLPEPLSTVSSIEQAVITESNSVKPADDIVSEIVKDEKSEKEENARRFVLTLSETLQRLQLEMTDILEDFEKVTTTGTAIPQSKLENSLEELRRTISTICVVTGVRGEQIIPYEEKVDRLAVMLINLLQPLTNIRELLSKTHEHDVLELTMLNRLTSPLDTMESCVIKQTIDFVGKDGDMKEEFESLLHVLKEIKERVPIVAREVSSRCEILECLRDISKPLENILERMSDLEKSEGDRLETDVARILGEPTAVFLRDIKSASQELDMLDRRRAVILELRNLVEPLLEFHSCLSMVQSSRRSLMPETSLLNQRKSVILRAVDDLQKQLCHTVQAIANMEKHSLFDESLMLLNTAILLVQKQIDKTDYSRSSMARVTLQHRLSDTLNRLASAIAALKEHSEKDTYDIVDKCLEALQKQICLAQTQLAQVGSQSIDEEAIVEGFLYPANQLLSALGILKENTQGKITSPISHDLMNQLRELADTISEVSSLLSMYRIELIREGASEGVPIVETFSAVIDVLDHVKDSVMTIDKIVKGEQETIVTTKVEDATNETAKISQEEMRTMEISPFEAATQEAAQSEIEDVSMITQTFDSENIQTTIDNEQKEDEVLADKGKSVEKQGKDEEQRDVYQIQISKLNVATNNLGQPLRELINFVKLAMQESLVSRSEEDKRKIRELTALSQILYDLQATSSSIKTILSSSSILLLDNQFLHLRNSLVDLEQVLNAITSLTDEEVRPELKEDVMRTLQSLAKPLNALNDTLASIYRPVAEDKSFNKDDGSSAIIANILLPCIDEAVKSLNAIQVLKCVKTAEDSKTELSKVRDEAKDIEETTAQPLEEIIEAIMVPREQVKRDKSSPLESISPSTELTEYKVIDDLSAMETEVESNIANVGKTDDSVTQAATDVIKTRQQMMLESTESPEEAQVQSPVIQQEANQLPEYNVIQAEAEALQTIISSVQVLHGSLEEVGKLKASKSDEETNAFAALAEILRNLELALGTQQMVLFEDIEKIKQSTVTLQKLPVACILEELQKSIAIIQEQVQLGAVAKDSSNETPHLRLMRAIEKPLADLNMSIAYMQTDPTIRQFLQQEAELSAAERISILQTLVGSVQQFEERFTCIISQIKMEVEYASPLQIVEEEGQKIDLKLLQKIIDPIQGLCEALSQIEDLQSYELSEIPEERRGVVRLNPLKHSLEKLERSLIVQQTTTVQEEVAKELGENEMLLKSTELKPVLEELRESIVNVQQQIVLNDDIETAKGLNEALENLKVRIAAVEEVDYPSEITGTEGSPSLLTFARTMEETTNQLLTIVNRQTSQQQETGQASLLQLITIPIEGLQSAILKLEDQVSQALEMKGAVKAITLERVVQPLQQLQQSLSIASHKDAILSLQRLPIKPILENLNKSVTMLQDQTIKVEDKLFAEATDSDDLTALKDFAGSLGDLRTSTVVLQQLNAIENAGQQIVEIENASALQAFAKSIEEFRKCCFAIIERPRIIEAFAISVELKEPIKVDAQLLENIIAPLRILQEQILTIEEAKMQESESLDIAESKPATVLSSLVGPLQQLEKSFVATVQKEHVIEHERDRLTPEEQASANLEKLALQPILQEVQKSIAIVQEHMILEAGSHVTSEEETVPLLKAIAQPLVDLTTSIASIQQVTAIAPDSFNELTQQQNIPALETFAENLHNLVECIAMCGHQHVIIEPAADTISEDVSSLNTWADVIEESSPRMTRPMVIDQDTIESPAETALSILEDEVSMLKILAKPLTELRECLVPIVEERKIIAPSETVASLSEEENISLLKTIIKPLLELKDAATLVIQEHTLIEHANEHSFAMEGNNEFILRPLVEPLEELRHSIAVIENQLLIETLADRPKDDIILNTLTEPLLDLQRAISVLETRVISPDIESISEDTNASWINERLAVSLHEIDKSIADIRQCTIMKPETIIMEKQERELAADWSIVEKLLISAENIKSVTLQLEDDITTDYGISLEPSAKIETLKTIIKPLTGVQENLTLLRNKSDLSAVDAVIESLSNLGRCISSVEDKIAEETISKQSNTAEMDATAFAALSLPLLELKRSIVNVEQSPSIYLTSLEGPLEFVQNALETILTTQRHRKLAKLSVKLLNTVLRVNDSMESMKDVLEKQQEPTGTTRMLDIQTQIERETLGTLTTSLQNIKRCIVQIQDKPSTANLMFDALQNFDKSIVIIRKNILAHKSAESSISKILIPYLQTLQESIEATKTLWHEETKVAEGLMILEKSFNELQTIVNSIREEFLAREEELNKRSMESAKKSAEEEIKKPEIETSLEKRAAEEETVKAKIEDTKLAKDESSTVEIGMQNKEDRKSPEVEEEKRKDITKLIHEETEQRKVDKSEKEKKKEEKTEETENKYRQNKTDQIEKRPEECKKEEKSGIEQEQIREKETEKVKEEATQKEKDIEDKKKYDKIKETESIKKQEGVENIEQTEMYIIESKRNEALEPKEIQKISKERDEQKNVDEHQKVERVTDEQREKEEAVIKKLSEPEKIEKDLSSEKEKAKDEKTKEVESIKKEEDEGKVEERQEKKQEDMEKSAGVKTTADQVHKSKDEIERINEEKGKLKKEETNGVKQEKEGFVKMETTEISKEEDKRDDESKSEEIKSKQKQESPKKDEEIENEQEDRNKENAAALKMNKGTQKKTDQLKKTEEDQKQQTEVESGKKEEKERIQEDAQEKSKEEEEKRKTDEKIEKRKRRKDKSDKKEESPQIKKEEEEQNKNAERPIKEDEKHEQTTQQKGEIKIPEDARKDEMETSLGESKIEAKSAENKEASEKQGAEKKVSKAEMEEEARETQSKYINNIEKDNKYISKREDSKETTEDKKQEEKIYIKEERKDKLNNTIQSLPEEDKTLSLTRDKHQEKRASGRIIRKQEEENESRKEKERRQRGLRESENWMRTEETDQCRIKREENDRQRENDVKRLHWTGVECLERRRRSEEKRISRDEFTRLLREEAQRLQRRQEEGISRSKQERDEQMRESDWCRRRQNESEGFLRNMLDTRYRATKSTAMFVDVDYPLDRREYTSRFDSGFPTSLTSASRSYSCRDSLASLSKRRADDYSNYKLRDFSVDKYYPGTGSFYRRARRRDNRMSRARSISLLKYDDYSIGNYASAHPVRRLNFDNYEFSSPSYFGAGQSEGLPWDKRKKPSFCTRLTNRIVGVGMRTRLTCTVLGNPEPRVHWTKDDQKLSASDGRYRTQFENGMAYLELYDTLPEDAGIYVCVAENTHGTSTTESTLKVYSDYKPTHSPPTFVRSIKDTHRYSERKLILECRVQAHPTPTVSWLKDGKTLLGERYKQIYLDDDVYQLEITDPNVSDNGHYTCRAENELRTSEISHMVYVEDRSQRIKRRYDYRDDEIEHEIIRPRFSRSLKDYGLPVRETVTFPTEFKETKIDTSATMDIISSSGIDGGKPAVFVSRPSKKSIDVIVGEDVSISFRVNGIPKPRVTWMKGLTDITDGPRSYKESIDDYVRLTLKRAIPSDEGTYCILVKNRYGCDRSFFSIKVKQRARSLTPLSDWDSITERDEKEEHDDDMFYIRNVPGPISSEPVVIDGGKNWLSLSWGKAERKGLAPVIAYKVDAWLLGGDGGARWMELGNTPINAFDAFDLRPGAEYKFRITPRNRYGWGESVTMTNSVLVSETVDLPEFTRILPGQLKALEGTTVKLECEIRGDRTTEVRWYRETTELDSRNDSRFAIYYNGFKCSLTIMNVKEDEAGRYVCEASNRIGKVSSFARVLVVTDPRIIEADAKLKTSMSIESNDRPPQFTMRIRDRRVQTTYPVRLTCQVTGYPAPEITWYKNGTEIFQDDRHVFWDDDSNFHTLEIIHSTLEDSGCYMVTARNINGSLSCRCTLVVDKGIRAYIAPEFLRGLDAAYTIQLGGELRMSTQLEAYPIVGVVWHRDGIRLRPSRRAIMTLSHDGTAEFSLANITARDAGVYSCTATNVVGHAEASTRVSIITDTIQKQSVTDITITSSDVPYSREPLFVTKPTSTEAIEGDTVVILCEVVGDPKPEVIWLRDFLKPDYYRDAPHFRLIGAGPQYRLEIPYAKLDFTGTYSVIARNCHGEAKAVISLQIYAKGQGKEEETHRSEKVPGLPIVKRELHDLRCSDGDAVSLECKVHAIPEPPSIHWERGGKIIDMAGDFAAEFDGETARLNIHHVYPEDEGEYTCVAYNDLGKAYTTACLVVDVLEGKENILSQRLTKPIGLLSAGSTPGSTPRSTPIRSLSPAVSHGRELGAAQQVVPRSAISKQLRVCPPKFYSMPHNRLVQEGETVHFQCAVVGHPTPWVRWDKNGIVVTPSARISLKERDDVKILEIVGVMREDAALYRITAENDFGRIEASARLEVISRYEATSRTVRTRSASPRTYPSLERTLLPTTSRINGRLQLECRIRGTPSPTPTWYRNGRPLERSVRIKRYFDGTTARIEISKVKAGDAGEYTCVATNILGSIRNSCQVTVLNTRDPSTADKSAPRFLQSLPKESMVMENSCYEFQTGITGTPPFTITWSKDGRELSNDNHRKCLIYGDGCVTLQLPNVQPQDAGEYSCVVRNDFGHAVCSGLLSVEDYRDIRKPALQFTKTPLSVVTVKGATAYFCARVQCARTTEVSWTINGKDARENAKCKIEKDGNVSILIIRDVSSHDTGVIRCTASVNGKHASVSCTAKLRLRCSLYNLGTNSTAMNRTNIESHSRVKLSSTCTNPVAVRERTKRISSVKYRQCQKTRIRSSSFSRRIACDAKHLSSLPMKKRTANSTSAVIGRSRSKNDLSTREITKTDANCKLVIEKLSHNQLPPKGGNDTANTSSKLLSPTKAQQLRNIDVTDNYTDNRIITKSKLLEAITESDKFNEYPTNEDMQEATHYGKNVNESEKHLEKSMKATIVNTPTDVTVLRGNRAIFKAAYEGYPAPTIKWFKVNRELHSDDKIRVINGNGLSWLTLYDVTYDHAGKYEVSVENCLGKDRRFFSLAVEGPPEPSADKPSASLSVGQQATVIWRSPLYDGGCSVLGYTVEAKRTGESTWMVIAESCHSLSHTVPTSGFVIPGESYRFRIRAGNIHGLSDPGLESDPIRIPREKEIMIQTEEEDNFDESADFGDGTVEPEERRLFDERYDVVEELGKGRYGIVRRVIERATSVNFAAKFVRTIKAKDREQVREEIRIMNALRHPKLLRLAAAYESPRETVMVTEYISGGELFERVVADDFTLTEWDSILFMRQICEGVEYMHQNKVVHLDLKPENIMCRTRTSHQIKLIDFGLAQTLKADTPIRVLFGTPEFVPPEIISYEPIGIESDMWSVGVICYVLLTGLSPFMGDNDAETFANVTRADYDLEDEAFDAISDNAKSFISGLLVKRKELRMSAKQCLEHPWMVQHVAAISRVVLPTEKLKKFIVRRKWQKTGNAIRALGRMAILSAHSRRSHTIAESPSTLEQQCDSNNEARYSDEGIKPIRVDNDEDMRDIKANAEENSVGTKSQESSHSLHTTKISMELHKVSTNDDKHLIPVNNAERKDIHEIESKTVHADDLIYRIECENEPETISTIDTTLSEKYLKEENNSNNLSKKIEEDQENIEEELPRPDTKLTRKSEVTSREITAPLENLMSRGNKVNDKQLTEESVDVEERAISRLETLRRMFQDDSRDRNPRRMTPLLQADKPDVTFTAELKVDRVNKRIPTRDETLINRQSPTVEISTNLTPNKAMPLCDAGSTKNDDKVATKSDVTKTSCETNIERKVADKNTDARILIGRNRNKFPPTGNVSRTARIFERGSETSKSDNPPVSTAIQPTQSTEKPHVERIQKAFAFWNK